MAKFKWTMTGEYEIPDNKIQEYYEASTAEEAAKCAEKYLEEGEMDPCELINEEATFKVEVVKDNG